MKQPFLIVDISGKARILDVTTVIEARELTYPEQISCRREYPDSSPLTRITYKKPDGTYYVSSSENLEDILRKMRKAITSYPINETVVNINS